MMMKPDRLLEIAIKAALSAGEEIMRIYRDEEFDIRYKPDDSPVTRADIAAHNAIMRFLDETGIPVLSEEGKQFPYEERKNRDTLWIVDPVDGTREFIKRNGEFTVNIALVKDQLPVLGVICVPALQELYFAAAELGSYKYTGIPACETIEEWKSVSARLPLKKNREVYTVVSSRSHLSGETGAFINALKEKYGRVEVISAGSSLKFCMVAEGMADCYPRFSPTMEWDTAAGQAICEHAGFKVIDRTTGEVMKYNRENLRNNPFLVS